MADYTAMPTRNKVFACMEGLGHLDGAGPTWGLYIAAFFQVHLNGLGERDAYYQIVYGRQQESMCGDNKTDFKMQQCIADTPPLVYGAALAVTE